MNLDRLADLLAKATPAPWGTDPSDFNADTGSVWAGIETMPPPDHEDDEAWDAWDRAGGGRVCDVEWIDDKRAAADAAAIIALRNTAPALIEIAEHAEAVLQDGCLRHTDCPRVLRLRTALACLEAGEATNG